VKHSRPGRPERQTAPCRFQFSEEHIDRLKPKRFVRRQRYSLPRIYHAIPLPQDWSMSDAISGWTKRIFLTMMGLSAGFASSIWATTEATIGAANEVPSTC